MDHHPFNDPIRLGAAIRDARHDRGWTQAELAANARVSRAFVSELERGARHRAELWRVLAVLRALHQAIKLVDDTRPATFEEALQRVLS